MHYQPLYLMQCAKHWKEKYTTNKISKQVITNKGNERSVGRNYETRIRSGAKSKQQNPK